MPSRTVGSCSRGQTAVKPPSTGKATPVTNEASSEQRKATAAAISAGSAVRGIGMSTRSAPERRVLASVGLVGEGAGLGAEPGRDDAGADAVGPDALVHVLDRHGPGELQDTALGGVVGALHWPAATSDATDRW